MSKSTNHVVYDPRGLGAKTALEDRAARPVDRPRTLAGLEQITLRISQYVKRAAEFSDRLESLADVAHGPTNEAKGSPNQPSEACASSFGSVNAQLEDLESELGRLGRALDRL